MRYVVTVGLILATVIWLVLSYVPAIVAALPKFAFDGAASARVLPWLVAGSLVVFLAIQVDLVRATAQWFRGAAGTETAQSIAAFRLRRGRELFWTLLPVLATLLLAIWLVIGS